MSDLNKKRMQAATMLAKIEDVVKKGKLTDPPAYTLVLGAGASAGLVPTAKEMLGIPDAKTGKIHEKAIPVWLAKETSDERLPDDNDVRLDCVKAFWKKFQADNAGNDKCHGIEIDANGLLKSESVAAGYKAVFNTACIGGLDTPDLQRNYLRAVAMLTSAGRTQLNATHFYLASLLALQKRVGQPGADNLPLYTGRREFARTIFTPNFDGLLQTSLQLFQLFYNVTDRPEYLSADSLQTSEHLAAHLFYAHSTIHRPYASNVEEQINQLKQNNARDLASYFGSHGVIVLGYSGWEDSLLEAMSQTKTFANNLYWLARGAKSISAPVAAFLASHPNAYWVEIEDGGSFMADLHYRLCPGAPNTEALLNPIRPMLNQFKYLNLKGIPAGGANVDKYPEKIPLDTDDPRDVESVRMQMIRRLEDAQKLFTETPKAGESWQELERMAGISYANKDWKAALTAYDQLLKRDEPKRTLSVEVKALALCRRAVCYWQQGEVEKAIIRFAAVIGLDGAPVEHVAKAQFNRGVCYGQMGDVTREIADYTAVLELAGAPAELVADALINRGSCYGQKGELDQAIADYTAVVEMPGALPGQIIRARFNRSVFYGRKGEVDRKIADYTAVIELPGAPVQQVALAMFNRAISYGQKGGMEREIADYTAVIELPGAPVEQIAKARVNRGVSYGQRGEMKREVADYTAAIELFGAPVEQIALARINRAISHGQTGDVDMSIVDYTAVIELPGAPVEHIADAQINRASSYARKGDADKAMADYSAVIELKGVPEEQAEKAKRLLKQIKPK